MPANAFDIQRTSFIAIILFWQIGIFIFRLFCARNRVFANFFNKIFQFDMQNYFAELSSLNSYELAPYPQAFPSGGRWRGERRMRRFNKIPFFERKRENLPKETVNILQNVFTNRENCDIIESAKPIKYANGYNFLLGEVYLFSDWTKIEFDKMQIPLCSIGYTCFALIGLATIGVCVFVR